MVDLTLHYSIFGISQELFVRLGQRDMLSHKEWAGTVVTGDDGETEPCTWHRVTINDLPLLEVPSPHMTMSFPREGKRIMVRMMPNFSGATVAPIQPATTAD